ncbi:tetratricopeptide repeat protein [Corticimicrobacter populi]|uniref:Tetratricopeptide repeat protein n=1 Tax=Corticimicrobacter populi TaxID=2175229 RepID=A0A2V1K0J6_9BURK|nr:tetratricopeptide repeat protein [Corticimicrobacter populi]PWF22650.1 hypothetical protein DD235_11270 [Corticimicrobacter populi]
MMNPVRFLLTSLGAGLLATGSASGSTHVSRLLAADDTPKVVQSAREVERIHLRQGELPEVKLTGDILYRILASEVAAQRGIYPTAASTLYQLAQSTRDPRLARRALEFSLAGGSLVNALEAARLWATLDPADPEADSSVLALSAANGQTRGLADELRQRMTNATDKVAALEQALQVLGRVRQRKQALDILDQVLDDQTRQMYEARLALSDLAFAAQEIDRAVLEARLALVARPGAEQAALRVLEYGVNLDQEQAIEDARTFVRNHPGAREVRLALVGLFVNLNRYGDALQELTLMRADAPEDFDLLLLQAEVNYQSERLDTARALLDQYLSVQTQRRRDVGDGASDASSAQADAYLLLARISQEQGKIEQAVQELGMIDDPDMQFQISLRQAQLYASQGQFDAALDRVHQAQARDDDERIQRAQFEAQLLREAGRVEAAIAVLEKADVDIPDATQIKYDLSMLYERVGRLDEMERLLRRIIEIDPSHAHAYNALGYTFADRNIRLDEAHTLISRALDMMPDNPYILDSMGWVLFRQGDLGRAQDYLWQAYRIAPESEIAAHLAEVMWQRGSFDEARQLLADGLRQEPDSAVLLETVKKLGLTADELISVQPAQGVSAP